jgi:hypothetical protein
LNWPEALSEYATLAPSAEIATVGWKSRVGRKSA